MRRVVGTRQRTAVKSIAAYSERSRQSVEDSILVAGCGCLPAISRATKVHRTGFANCDTICNNEISGVSMSEAEWSMKKPCRSSGVLSRMEGHGEPPIITVATQYWIFVSRNGLNNLLS